MSRTGRTTRMLAKAEEMAERGLTVRVFAANSVHLQQMERLLKPESKVQLSVVPFNFDWRLMTVPGMSGWVFVDHWAIENHFGRMLGMLHKFDKPEKKYDEKIRAVRG